MIEPETDRERRVVEVGIEAPIPDKLFFRIGEVADLTGVPPYVLRYWESEFKLLRPRKNHAGQRVYRKHDVEMVLRIKSLLYEDRLTLEGAKKRLQQEGRQRSQQLELPAPDPQTLAALRDDPSPAGGDPADAAARFPLNRMRVRRTIREVRGVAQPGSALAWGARGRWFKSSRPDHYSPTPGRGGAAALRTRFRPGRPRAA